MFFKKKKKITLEQQLRSKSNMYFGNEKTFFNVCNRVHRNMPDINRESAGAEIALEAFYATRDYLHTLRLCSYVCYPEDFERIENYYRRHNPDYFKTREENRYLSIKGKKYDLTEEFKKLVFDPDTLDPENFIKTEFISILFQ